MDDAAELRAVLGRIADELRGIRVCLELITAPESEPEPTNCLHPVEARIDFGMTNGLPDWQCRLCQYRTETET